MADAMQETDSAILLVAGEAAQLKAAQPGHELLQFAETFANMNLPEGFRERFGGDRISECHRGTNFAVAAMYMNYYDDLRKAQGKS